ncbi:MAG: hypothetical protein HY287_02600 [Planctomycetes bacterium]|nr:hypothetical protein [Planctomycetota bacterium]
MPTGDPLKLDATRMVQEFTLVAFIFDATQGFALSRSMWEASISGGSMIGLPIGPEQPTPAGVANFVPHERGVVLGVPEAAPQPLPQAVFDLWIAREVARSSLGPPTAFGFPSTVGKTFPFLFGSITLTDTGAASVSGQIVPDLQRFFQPDDIGQGLFRRTLGENATPLIDGDVTLARMSDDIKRAIGSRGSFVYILSWHFDLDFNIIAGDPSSALRSLLFSFALFGGQVRAMLWAGDPISREAPFQLAKEFSKFWEVARVVNEPAVNFINALKARGNDAAAIFDSEHLPFGSHHQKVIIVGTEKELIAYVGGIEPNRNRLESVAGQDGSPLFDISVRLEGAGAWRVLRTFITRWNLHPNKFGSPLLAESLAEPLPAGGPLAVQVTHTYGRGFPFVSPVQTASTAIANGIRSARQFFYMEDQYFVGSPKMDSAIRDALSRNSNLVGIIVIAAEDCVTDLPDLPFRRRKFLGPLFNDPSFAGRVLVFERLGGGSTIGPSAYVHSKLLIVDDEAAFIGSVNSSRRSWFHDSEIAATIVDATGPGGEAPGQRGWVRDFRCNLWSRHFGLAPALLGNFATCLAIWQAIINLQTIIVSGVNGVISVRPYDVNATVPRYAKGMPNTAGARDRLLEKLWNTLEDPS